MLNTKERYEIFFREICDCYTDAEMMGDKEMMTRLSRARILFKYNNMENINNMTFEEIHNAVIEQDTQTILADFKAHFRNKEN